MDHHLQGIGQFQATLEKHQHGPECGPKSSNEGDPAQGQDGVEHLMGEPSACIVVSVQFNILTRKHALPEPGQLQPSLNPVALSIHRTLGAVAERIVLLAG
jgi:hypothetical protein